MNNKYFIILSYVFYKDFLYYNIYKLYKIIIINDNDF